MNEQRLMRLSKLLSYVLRHKPEEFDVALDGAGWTDVVALLAALDRHGATFTRRDLAELLDRPGKRRFELSADGRSIRASYGHSVAVDLGLPPAEPPEELFHGTVAESLAAIRADGLKPGQRQLVHLSGTRREAEIVASRRGNPIVLVVRAAEMRRAGQVFHRAPAGIWLTTSVPPQFLVFPGDV